MATLGRLLAGEYELALITTEGIETPTVDHWRILLIPVDSAWQKLDGLTGDWIRYPVAGTRTDLAPRTPADSLRRRRLLATSDIEMSVDLRTGRLQWMTAPGSSHGGDIFDVGEVSDSLLFGRWRHGGIIMVTLKRGDLEVGESWRGYYCAWKIR